jgi:hypothetical protein
MSAAWDDDVTLTVEMGFGDGVYDDPSWTDITAYARGFTCIRGKDNAGDATNPGTAALTLDNTDGRFDPTYTGGAYYPDIVPMVQTRIRAAYDITGALELDHGSHGQVGDPLQCGTVDVWRGYASNWPQEWPGNADATVPVVLVDGHKLLNLDYVNSGSSGVEDVWLGVEPTGKRIGHLLDRAVWPVAWRHLPVGSNEQPGKNYTSTVLTAIREANEVEQGTAHITTAGVFELQPYGVRTGWTTQVTFGDDPGEAPYTDLGLGYDDDQIWNQAEIDIVDGGQYVRLIQSSIDRYGRRVQRQQSIAAPLMNINAGRGSGYAAQQAAQSQGDAIIDQYVEPFVRVDEITFMPHKDPTVLWPAALGLDVGSKITVTRRPPAGNTITVDCYIEGIEHRVTPGEPWETTWRLSQYS